MQTKNKNGVENLSKKAKKNLSLSPQDNKPSHEMTNFLLLSPT